MSPTTALAVLLPPALESDPDPAPEGGPLLAVRTEDHPVYDLLERTGASVAHLEHRRRDNLGRLSQFPPPHPTSGPVITPSLAAAARSLPSGRPLAVVLGDGAR